MGAPWSRVERTGTAAAEKSSLLQPAGCSLQVLSSVPECEEASHREKPSSHVGPTEDEDADLPPSWKSADEASEDSEGGRTRSLAGSRKGHKRSQIKNDCASKVPWDHEMYAMARLYKDTRFVSQMLMEIVESNRDMVAMIRKITVPTTSAISYPNCMRALLDRKVCDYDTDHPLVSFSTRDTSDALLDFSRNPNARVCGLCFGNGSDPGGGYMSGARGQEEDLCRRIPALYESLDNARECYPFGPATLDRHRFMEVLYTPGVVIARGSEAQGFRILSSAEQGVCSIVNASPPMGANQTIDDLTMRVCGSVTSIFVAPLLMDPTTTTLVLGGWGCGSDGLSATKMAHIFAQAMVGDIQLEGPTDHPITIRLGRLYREIHFAIPKKTAESQEDVADIFKSVLTSEKYKKRIRFEER